jgi:hypothetical protein
VVAENELEEFEKQFPKREKHITATQLKWRSAVFLIGTKIPRPLNWLKSLRKVKFSVFCVNQPL